MYNDWVKKRSIIDYRWDFDMCGSYLQDGGKAVTVSEKALSLGLLYT